MPIFKTKNEDFFKTWSPEMAYVLGFFTADGSMYQTKRGTHFIEFQITDGELLKGIKALLGSNHKITTIQRNKNHKIIYRLQIGSKKIFSDLINRGLTQNKSKTICLPKIPNEFFRDFLRGYFDGDGNVIFSSFKRADRKNSSKIFLVRFTSGSKSILEEIKEELSNLIKTKGSLLEYGGAWRLSYSTFDSLKLFQFMYKSERLDELIFLKRKYTIFKQADLHFAGVA